MKIRELFLRLRSVPESRLLAALIVTVVSASFSFSADAKECNLKLAPKPGQKIALITGSTSGLGRELALRLGAKDMFVIVHGRDSDRGNALVQEIRAKGVGGACFYAADFGSFDEVRSFAKSVLNDFDRLDLLINNAGIASTPPGRVLSKDGYELRFQVNYLSHFLLTRMLLPRLLKSAPSRIINISSLSQQAIDFDDVMLTNNFSVGRAYAQSKLALVMTTFDLAEELKGKGVSVNALHPATYMDTPMVTSGGGKPMSTVGEGADAVMQLVTDDMGSGGYFVGKRVWRANSQAYDLDARAKLKKLSEELTGASRKE